MQLRKYFRSDSAPQERRGLFSSPFVKRKGSENYATIIPLEERQRAKQLRSHDKRHYVHRTDSHNSITASSTLDSQDKEEHSRKGSKKSTQFENVQIATNIIESPVEVHQVDDDGTLTKDKPNVSMEAVENYFDDILKNSDDVTIDRKCDCVKKTAPPCVKEEIEINDHSHNVVKEESCENCDYARNSGKEDSNRNSIHNSGTNTESSSYLQSPDDKTLTKDSRQYVGNDTTTDVLEDNTETPKIETLMLNKTVESELKCDPPACDSPDLGVDDTSPTGTYCNAIFIFLL